MTPRAVILGCEKQTLTHWEKEFFSDCNPFGFILFARNCENPDQVRKLVRDLRACVGREDAPVLIDQEGGRVARLKPPHWRAAPAAARFGALAERDSAAACRATWINARLLAAELLDLGVTVDCIPLLDLAISGAHSVIGDRAFGADPDIVARLGRSVCEGLLAGGVMPVIKHIPGHGRATVDSHEALPVVDAALDVLAAKDFEPFRLLADAPWAMTGHVVYTALDSDHPATTSKIVIDDIIRGSIGFDGVLVSDDLSMQALSGDLEDRAGDALAAGCDIALHCNGKADEMTAVANAVGKLTAAAEQRIAIASTHVCRPDAINLDDLTGQLEALLGKTGEDT